MHILIALSVGWRSDYEKWSAETCDATSPASNDTCKEIRQEESLFVHSDSAGMSMHAFFAAKVKSTILYPKLDLLTFYKF